MTSSFEPDVGTSAIHHGFGVTNVIARLSGRDREEAFAKVKNPDSCLGLLRNLNIVAKSVTQGHTRQTWAFKEKEAAIASKINDGRLFGNRNKVCFAKNRCKNGQKSFDV